MTPPTLTEEQSFAFCLAAGVPIETAYDPETGKMTLRTAHPCAVMWTGAGYQVATRPQHEGERRVKHFPALTLSEYQA